ncbi:MAG: 4Fe-4S dicluster domain-containing protein [Candidatus Woesearchaeota archaeon]
MAYLLKKSDFNDFVEIFLACYDVIAPVRDDIIRYKFLKKEDASRVLFNLPAYSVKDFFMPIKEKLLEFNKEKINEVKTKTRKTVFLMNRCDVNAVHRNDLIMLSDPIDPYYQEKRKAAYLIETPCIPSEKCMCIDLGLIDCFDIKMIPDKDNFILDIRTEKGEELIEKVKKNNIQLKETEHKSFSPIPYIQKQIMTDNKEVWENYEKKCLSCSACTITCPTCMCFTIDGHLELDVTSGYRYREWASCQLNNFTKVAGNHVFRRDRGSRGMQRIHCKFQYFKEKFGYLRCVGCGRCISSCPVRINIFEYHGRLK